MFNYLYRLITLFTAQLPIIDEYESTTEPIFVVGCGRSGTTLLRVILDTHSKIACGPELTIIHEILTNDKKRKWWRPANRCIELYRSEVLNLIEKKFGINVEKIAKIRDNSKCLAEFVDAFFKDYLKLKNKIIWAEKTPKNCRVIPFLLKYFPKARFVHIVRDGRDVACSLRNHPKYKHIGGKMIETGINRPVEECAQRWVDDVRASLAIADLPNYFGVNYEDLVERTESTLRELFDFLGIGFENSVLEYMNVHDNSRDIEHFPPSQGAAKPIYKSSIARWKKDLSCREQKIFSQIAGDLLVQLGYEKDDGWVCKDI